MMARHSISLFYDFRKNTLALDFTRIKVENLFKKNIISKRDIKRVYEGLYLNLFVLFESFLEDLFVGLLISEGGLYSSSKKKIKPRITIKSHKIARETILSRQNYIKWLPYECIKEYSEIYFRNGRPFTNLNQIQIDTLHKFVVIRNSIAHKNKSCIKKFEKSVIGTSALPPEEKTPVGYLRGLFRTLPDQTRYENIVNDLSSIAKTLSD